MNTFNTSLIKPVGAQVAAEIVSKLVKSRDNFDVIDRNEIDNIMKEQNYKFSPRFDPQDAPRLGKLLNVSAIVTGAVESLAGEVQKGVLGIGAVGMARNEAVVEAQASVRVVNTETGRILVAETVDKKGKHNLGGGMTVKRPGLRPGIRDPASARTGWNRGAERPLYYFHLSCFSSFHLVCCKEFNGGLQIERLDLIPSISLSA